jgi:hypothetical protein
MEYSSTPEKLAVLEYMQPQGNILQAEEFLGLELSKRGPHPIEQVYWFMYHT